MIINNYIHLLIHHLVRVKPCAFSTHTGYTAAVAAVSSVPVPHTHTNTDKKDLPLTRPAVLPSLQNGLKHRPTSVCMLVLFTHPYTQDGSPRDTASGFTAHSNTHHRHTSDNGNGDDDEHERRHPPSRFFVSASWHTGGAAFQSR